jgi:probable O-glycosylation ligase (exosortase A-associated)
MGRINAWWMAWNLAKARPIGGGFEVITPELFQKYAPDPLDLHAAHSIYFQVLGEHGFIGLALYLLILLLGLRNSQIIRRQTRNRPELLWAYDMASMLQVAVIGFCIGGAALSMAYYDGFLLLIALLSTLRELTTAQTASAGADAPGRFRFAPAPGAAATRAPAPVWRLRAGHTGAQDN